MDFRLDGGRPGDERGFVHKRIGKFLKGPLGEAALGIGTSFVSGLVGGRGKSRPTVPRTQTSRVTGFSDAEKELGRSIKFGGNGGGRGSGGGRVLGGEIGSCPRGFRPDFITGICEPAAGQEFGEAVMGRYGAGLVPGSRLIDRAVCLSGMVVGDDGICYNRAQISNKQRMWPAGRKPLLTGGEMNAIRIADRAKGRVARTAKRLGIQPASSRRRKRLPPGRGLTIKEAGAGSVTVQ